MAPHPFPGVAMPAMGCVISPFKNGHSPSMVLSTSPQILCRPSFCEVGIQSELMIILRCERDFSGLRLVFLGALYVI
jgi:hypothetical protein